MPSEPTLFDKAGGSPLRAYLLMKSAGSANIPPMWIERTREARKKREKTIATVLKKGTVQNVITLEDWELSYRKECFYRGIRALLELERTGKTKL